MLLIGRRCVLVAVQWGLVYVNPPFWTIAPRPLAATVVLTVCRALGIVGSLVACVPHDTSVVGRLALPGRLALRLLWWCIRLETIVFGIE